MNAPYQTRFPWSRHWPFLIIALPMTIFYLWNIRLVPFHPDESTQLFTSGDFEILVSSPLSMTWDPARQDDLRQRYRQLDAPLTRYIIGVGRTLAGLPALGSDWDWSKSWEENQQAGALPDEKLLFVGRLSVALLFPLSLWFIYQIGAFIGKYPTGLLAAFLLGTHALILLHTRRAMAESALVFGITFAVWCFLAGDHRTWLAGLGMALAFNAKQSTIALFPAGLIAVTWQTSPSTRRTTKRIHNLIMYVGMFSVVTILLNPIWWRQPLQSVQAAWVARQDLLEQQLADTQRLAPEKTLSTPTQRVEVLIANLYIVSPSFYEVGNYVQQTALDETRYLSIPGHNLWRGFIAGGILLLLTLLGIAVGILNLRRVDNYARRELSLLLLATILQIAFLVMAIPLPWQRYVIPTVPFICIWSAYAFYPLTRVLFDKKGLP
jgi:4-amino-4-deoxy-L-arabinose transferase-like glycosyltransferase